MELVASYARRTIDFVDKGRWVYNWLGQRTRERTTAGEVSTTPRDQTLWQDSVFARGLIKWDAASGHVLRASFTPNFATRTGRERLRTDPNAPDPLAAQRDLFTLVSGLEYELNLFGDRRSNVIFWASRGS